MRGPIFCQSLDILVVRHFVGSKVRSLFCNRRCFGSAWGEPHEKLTVGFKQNSLFVVFCSKEQLPLFPCFDASPKEPTCVFLGGGTGSSDQRVTHTSVTKASTLGIFGVDKFPSDLISADAYILGS